MLEADDVEARWLSEVAVVELTVLLAVWLTVVLAVERDVLELVAIPLHMKL